MASVVCNLLGPNGPIRHFTVLVVIVCRINLGRSNVASTIIVADPSLTTRDVVARLLTLGTPMLSRVSRGCAPVIALIVECLLFIVVSMLKFNLARALIRLTWTNVLLLVIRIASVLFIAVVSSAVLAAD